MVKHTFLVSPYGDLSLRVLPEHVLIQASDQLAGDWGLGWWHAQSAGDQMIYARALWSGRLGESGKPTPARAEVDAFMGAWGFAEGLDLETAALPSGHRSRVHAYVQGFNQGRRRHSREAPWGAGDCHLLARTLGFLEWWETRAPQLRFLLEAWRAGLAWGQILDLWPGLGAEPNVGDWDGIQLPPEASPEAQALLVKVRRFRPFPATVVPGSRSADGKPLLAGGFVTDVTDPGLPFLPVRIDTPLGSLRGLSLPGHPGMLAGRTGWLAWHASPAVDDTIDLRVVPGTRALRMRWVGQGRTGTLGALLALEESPTVEAARERTQGAGTASLDVGGIDSGGGADRWALGCRWRRLSPRETWLPALTAPLPSALPRELPPEKASLPGRVTLGSLVSVLTAPKNEWVEGALATLRFLLPDSEAGQRLRRWTGAPDCPEAADFERLYGAVLDAFWEASPVLPAAASPVTQALAATVDTLVRAPHSSWFPSSVKNQRLAAAVRRAFTGAQAAPPILARHSSRPCWTEVHGGKPRTLALTTALVVQLADRGWSVYHTDDETEPPVFRPW